MEARIAHWKQKWKIPGTSWTVSGYSRAAYRTGFQIPELGIMLDAGPQCFSNPKHIFITHTHGDHIANLPFTLIVDQGQDIHSEEFIKPTLYGPEEARVFIKNYISALFTTNAMTPHLRTQIDQTYNYRGYTRALTDRINIKNTDYDLQIFICDHAIKTISYGFSSISKKLRDEYKGLKGTDIKALRESGVEITREVPTKKFAYICDTSIKVLETHPEILEYPLVFIECTFLYDDELDNARKTKHIHWYQLRDYVRNNPQTTFLLMHFSLRYKNEEILEYFAKEMGLYDISNLKVWAGDTTHEIIPIELSEDEKLEVIAQDFVRDILEKVVSDLCGLQSKILV